MQRLREQTSSSDPATARAAALLAAAAPFEADRLRRRPIPAEAVARGPVFGVRATLVLAISLGSVVAAAATLERTQWWPGARGAGSSTRSVAQVTAAPQWHERDTRAVIRPVAPVQETAAEVAPLAPEAPAPEVSSPAAPPRASAAGVRPVSRESDRSAAEHESALIVDAVRALRRDRDPARALALSEQALQRYPHGAQVEEAMALAMESAFALGDAAMARQSAQRYLEAFGSGRFADRAQQILSAVAKLAK